MERVTELAIQRGDSLLLRYKGALEGLTPGGSEFVDAPERCAAFVRQSQDSRWRHILKLTRRIKALEANRG